MKTSINNLILISLHRLEEPSSFEKLTARCFEFFPEYFGLAGYPQWPDSRQLDRPLRRLVADKMIKKQKNLLALTTQGRKMAEQANTFLRQEKLIQ